jgi:hypothetical protein
LVRDKNYLGDLLGTKYIRENQLKKALTAFEAVGEKYWEENYNAWERGRYDEHYQLKYNPFYELEYTFDFIEKRDSFIVTKPNLTKQLIHYLALAENPTTEDQDYYYFLVANCYFNMTTSGNSWVMRRYWNSTRPTSSHIDNDEFTSRLLAQKYYQRAYETAKTDEFRALCLRMVDYAEKQTIYSPKVKKQYPQYFEELSQCYYFQNFFKARRKKSL